MPDVVKMPGILLLCLFPVSRGGEDVGHLDKK